MEGTQNLQFSSIFGLENQKYCQKNKIFAKTIKY